MTHSSEVTLEFPYLDVVQKEIVATRFRSERMLWLHTGLLFSPAVASAVRQLRGLFEHSMISVVQHTRMADQPQGWLFSNTEQLAASHPASATLLPQHLGQVTGYRNRSRACLLLQEKLASSAEFMVVICDIDQFQSISFFYGQRAATAALIQLSNVLADAFPEGEVFELMGDHFMLWLPLASYTPHELEQTLVGLSRQDLLTEGYRINLTASFGVLVCRNDAERPAEVEDALSAASISLNKAKREKKSIFFYSGKAHLKMEYGLRLRSSHLLSEALRKNTLSVFFQPYFSNDTGEMLGQECLARIRHQQGWVGAEQFLGQEANGRFRSALTLKVMETACQTFAATDTAFSVNITPDDLMDSQVRSTLLYLIDRYQMGGRLTLECSGFSRKTDMTQCCARLQRFRDMGCRIALDDFGRGYANFADLELLAPDMIKLDGTLIRELDRSRHVRSIARGVVQIAHDLGLQTVAEHVHSREVYHWVRDMGIVAAQGFLLGKPRNTPWAAETAVNLPAMQALQYSVLAD